eukprot:1147342-Pelagomonas_calceolata.AAC.1
MVASSNSNAPPLSFGKTFAASAIAACTAEWEIPLHPPADHDAPPRHGQGQVATTTIRKQVQVSVGGAALVNCPRSDGLMDGWFWNFSSPSRTQGLIRYHGHHRQGRGPKGSVGWSRAR